MSITCDGNEAVARIAHYLSDSIILFPITPSTPMVCPSLLVSLT